MKARQIKSNLMLMLTALIWGAAFVAQSVSMDYVGPVHIQCGQIFYWRVGIDSLHEFSEKIKQRRSPGSQ